MIPIDREFAMQALIALSISIGGWLTFIKPKADELHGLERSILDGRQRVVGIDHDTVARVAARAPRIRARCAEVMARGALAKDSSALYGRIMSLAKDHEIEIKSLRPGNERGAAGKDQRMAVT